jgi:hypothetical protein
MTAVLPGGNNTFVPSHEASGKLVVDFSRNVKKFAVNQYTKIVTAPQSIGYYLKSTIDEAGRILDDDVLDALWNDGENAPGGRDGTREHEYKAFQTARRLWAFTLGDKAVQQATWDIVAQHAATKAQQAMTARTMLALQAVLTTGNHISSHVVDISSVTGNTGTWAASTSNRQDIKRSLNVARELILDDTLAAVDIDDLYLVINSTLARQLSECQEIVEYIKGSPDALAQIKGELRGSNQNAYYGLPSQLYGLNLIVEKTRRVTSRKRATSVKTQVLPTATPFIVARPGSLEGTYGAPNFSAVTGFMYEEMTAETKKDKDNRRTSGRIVEDYVYVLTAPECAVMFQNAV